MVRAWIALSLVLWFVAAVYLLVTGNSINQILPLALLASLFFVIGIISALAVRPKDL